MFRSRYFGARYWLARFFHGVAATTALAKVCISDEAGTTSLALTSAAVSVADALFGPTISLIAGSVLPRDRACRVTLADEVTC